MFSFVRTQGSSFDQMAAPEQKSPVVASQEIKLANYVLKQRLGSGTFGVVFRATDENGHEFAVKRFRKNSEQLTPEAAQREQSREIENTSRLIKVEHPNLVNVKLAIHDPGDDEFLPGQALVFEYCTAGTLSGYIQRRQQQKELTPLEVIRIGQHILAGLSVLHSHKLVHSDMATRNIFVTSINEQLVFKIGDYGQCRYLENEAALGTRVVESLHGPPEERLSYPSDVFGVGVMLYEVMSRQVIDVMDNLESERKQLVERLNDLRPTFGKDCGLIDVVLRMVSESAIDRYQNGLMALHALSHLDMSSKLSASVSAKFVYALQSSTRSPRSTLKCSRRTTLLLSARPCPTSTCVYSVFL